MSTTQELRAAAEAFEKLSPEEKLRLLLDMGFGQTQPALGGLENLFGIGLQAYPHNLRPEELIKVGTIVYGFCNGVFGRDSYDDKVVVARGEYKGEPWAVLAEVDDWREKKWLYFASGTQDFRLMADNLQPEDEN